MQVNEKMPYHKRMFSKYLNNHIAEKQICFGIFRNSWINMWWSMLDRTKWMRKRWLSTKSNDTLTHRYMKKTNKGDSYEKSIESILQNNLRHETWQTLEYVFLFLSFLSVLPLLSETSIIVRNITYDNWSAAYHRASK